MRALTQFKPAGTKSFRLAASMLFDYGLNGQNPDKDILDIFWAPDGYEIVQADQEGAEALVVAALAPPGRYRALFQHGIKPHIYVALHLFLDKFRGDYPPERYWLQPPEALKALPEWATLSAVIASSPFEYDLGKRTGHASNYRMGPATFRESCLRDTGGTLVLSIQQAARFLTVYKTLFPEIVEWQNEIEHTIQTTRLLRNLFGFPRRFEGNITDGYVREAISWIPQSTVGCLTHNAFLTARAAIHDTGRPWRLFNNKHDSLAAIVPTSDRVEAGRLLSTSLAQTLTGRDGYTFTMKSEVQCGRNWGKFSESNPHGMRKIKL